MPRRVGLPGAAELFRTTESTPSPVAEAEESTDTRRTTGRVRHEEKITVYVSSDELLALEQSRLVLRARHGLAVDRGRIVRTAISLALADLEEHGDDSDLVRALGSP